MRHCFEDRARNPHQTHRASGTRKMVLRSMPPKDRSENSSTFGGGRSGLLAPGNPSGKAEARGNFHHQHRRIYHSTKFGEAPCWADRKSSIFSGLGGKSSQKVGREAPHLLDGFSWPPGPPSTTKIRDFRSTQNHVLKAVRCSTILLAPHRTCVRPAPIATSYGPDFHPLRYSRPGRPPSPGGVP
jgi:hypothetical protein